MTACSSGRKYGDGPGPAQEMVGLGKPPAAQCSSAVSPFRTSVGAGSTDQVGATAEAGKIFTALTRFSKIFIKGKVY